MFLIEANRQSSENEFIRAVAQRIVDRAGASDQQSKILALRDYLRNQITYEDASIESRPFLRATAAETLRSGRGYCGEVTRLFIQMARSVGIRAQRINLFGKHLHVVAEAEFGQNRRVIVDSQNPPQIKNLESLDNVMLRPEYDDYSTLNLRRLRLSWLVSRLKIEMGYLGYLAENPHALKAVAWLSFAIIICLMRILLVTGKVLMRQYLKSRGWVHISTTASNAPDFLTLISLLNRKYSKDDPTI